MVEGEDPIDIEIKIKLIKSDVRNIIKTSIS